MTIYLDYSMMASFSDVTAAQSCGSNVKTLPPPTDHSQLETLTEQYRNGFNFFFGPIIMADEQYSTKYLVVSQVIEACKDYSTTTDTK